MLDTTASPGPPPPEPGRVLALDVGGRRIGVALSDTTQRLATPLTTLAAAPRPHALLKIATLVAHHDVVAVVIGLPLSLDGTLGPQAQLTQRFGAALAAQIAIPVHYEDERFTSAAAERMMIELGIRADRRRAQIDQVAASLILQDFLDRTREAP